MTDHLQLDIQGAEQCKLVAYRDSKGLWTIGWGHLMDQTVDQSGVTITQVQADNLLALDISSATAFADKLTEWPELDTECRQNAVIELCFNMRGKWYGFVKTRAAIRAQDWQTAHDELLNSDWADEVHATRANRIAGYLLTGQYP